MLEHRVDTQGLWLWYSLAPSMQIFLAVTANEKKIMFIILTHKNQL